MSDTSIKILQIFLIVLVVFIFSPILLPLVGFTLYHLLGSCVLLLTPGPPRPEITYGEFPFRLVYEIHGEQIIIEDTIIAEFDGIRLGAGGRQREWTARFASTGESAEMGWILFENAEKSIYMHTGSAHYYMGDGENLRTPIDNTVRMRPATGFTEILSKERLLEEHGIRIIEWTHSPPIVNTFR